MTEEEKATQREFREALGMNKGLSAEQIKARDDAEARDFEIMAKPDGDPEKISYMFDKASRG